MPLVLLDVELRPSHTARGHIDGETRGERDIAREREILEVALRIVATEGFPALSMSRVSRELGISTGALYDTFPSKNALVAELQRVALEALYRSFLLSQSNLDDLVAERGLDPRAHALARVVGAARFWIAAEEVLRHEIELSRRVFTDPVLRFSDEDAARFAPAAQRMVDHFERLLDQATVAGALGEGDSMRRAVIVVAGTTGILLTGVLERFQPGLFHARPLAALALADLMAGWGARPGDIEQASELVATLAEHGRLVPPPGEE